MERYDMYCQICDSNIYNALLDWMFREHFYCPQSIDNWSLIKKAYPRTRFKVFFENGTIKEIVLEEEKFSSDYATCMRTHVRKMFENNGGLVHVIDGTGRGMSVDKINLRSKIFFQNFVFDDGKFVPKNQRNQMDFWSTKKTKRKPRFPKSLSGIITWREYDKEDEYYKKAKLIRHVSHKRNGHHINDYNICPKCAKKLNFRCDLCNKKFKKENH